MLEAMRRGQRWLMMGVILLVGGVFVFYLGVGGPGIGTTTGSLVEVGNRRYSLLDLQRLRENQERQLRESLGDAFDPRASASYLDGLAADQLIQRAILATEAERLGLRASDDEVRQVVRGLPLFRAADGSFEADRVRDYGRRFFGSETRFVAEIRDDILIGKLLRLIDASAAVSEPEAREALRLRNEEIRIAFVALDETRTPGAVVEEGEIEALLSGKSERVRAFYDQHPDRFSQPERVRARHILIRLEPGASEAQIEEARERAQAALERVRGGENFEAVAREVSEDPGSKDRGGDLGLFPRGQMAPAFEEAAFSLGEGETSELVRTEFGFHVIRVEEHREAEERSFDEAAHEIAEELIATDRAREQARATAERLSAAIRDGASLTDAARAEGLTLERPDWLRRNPRGYLEGLGTAPEVLTTAFALEPAPASSDRIFEVEDKLVLVELLEQRDPEDTPAALEAERERLLAERRDQARTVWMRDARQRLTDAGELRVDLTALQQS